MENDNGDTVKLKRLLTKFRTDSEVNLLRELKSSLEKDNNVLDGDAGVKNGEGEQSVLVENVISDTSVQEGREDMVDRAAQDVSDNIAVNPVTNLAPVVKKLCKFGKRCDTTDCKFSHDYVQKPCRFWPKCRKGDSCLFLHVPNDMTGGNGGNGCAPDRRYAVEANSNSVSFHGQPGYGMVSGPRPLVTCEAINSGTGSLPRAYPVKG